MTLARNNGTTGTWDTSSVANGSVTLIAYFRFTSPAASGDQYAYSPAIVVTVKNGYIVDTDAAKTYAKVTQPTNGQSIVADGATFSITSDHQITWTRYDNCGDYYVSMKFRRSTDYPTVLADIVLTITNYQLPKQVGDCPVLKTLGDSPYVAGGPAPATYVVSAFCYSPDIPAQVADGSSNFTMAPAPHSP